MNMKPVHGSALVMAAATLILGCGIDPLLFLGGWDSALEDCGTSSYTTQRMTCKRLAPVDLLVVVDNTLTMVEEQEKLAEEFPALIESLLNPPDWDGDTRPEHLPVQDLHVGVISTDMGTGGYIVETCSDPEDGDDGHLLHGGSTSREGCEGPFHTYLSYDSAEPDPAAISTIAHDFGCMATLGVNGCSFEQQMRAAVRAIEHTEPGGPNQGFLRRDSVLAILFVTDEDDCSVAEGSEGIFDTLDSYLGHLNLRCFHNPYMLAPVESFVEAFRAMRDDPRDLVLAFLVGVPQGDVCEGYGDEIARCLEVPEMQERVDPVSMTRLVPICSSRDTEAFPARRFVQVAQAMGGNAHVMSICNDDFGPALSGLRDKLHWTLEGTGAPRNLTVTKDPEDPCRCVTSCRIVEGMESDLPCPDEKSCVRSDGPESGCRVDWDGARFQSLCEIPQAGTRIKDCDPDAPPGCDDPDVVHVPDTRGGWYYVRPEWMREVVVGFCDTEIGYTDGTEPGMHSQVTLNCEECLGPPLLAPGTGGVVGAPCRPLTCNPAYDPEGNPLDVCDWSMAETYVAEAGECGGGACLVFRHDHDSGPYCSRRCGPSLDGRGCPDGYTCMAAHDEWDLSPACWCVRTDQLRLDMPGDPDHERVRICR